MNQVAGKVFIVDDDQSVRSSISLLLKSEGIPAESFGNAEEFLCREDYHGEGCIILDIFLEGRSGLELQEAIHSKFKNQPIIYITGQGDIAMSVKALKNGAINFLEKPVDDKVLLKAVSEALLVSQSLVGADRENTRVKSLVEILTPREFQVFRQLVSGKLNKQIAADLNIAEHTVKLHRGKITEKLQVKSTAELVRLAEKLHL
jgi:two-component system, LuxR family, response regulator FixJ